MERSITKERSSFGDGPKTPKGLLRVAHEIAINSVNTVERKQQANEEYYNAIKNAGKNRLTNTHF